jgi:hypothetical protein
MKLYGHISISTSKSLQKVLNMKPKDYQPRGRVRSRWKQQVRKDATKKKGKI